MIIYTKDGGSYKTVNYISYSSHNTIDIAGIKIHHELGWVSSDIIQIDQTARIQGIYKAVDKARTISSNFLRKHVGFCMRTVLELREEGKV